MNRFRKNNLAVRDQERRKERMCMSALLAQNTLDCEAQDAIWLFNSTGVRAMKMSEWW